MAKKRYTLKEAQAFVRQLGKKDLAGVLNTFDGIKKSMKMFVIRDDEHSFNRLAEEYFKSINSNRGNAIKKAAHDLLETLCYEVDKKTLLRKGSAVELFQGYLGRMEIRYNVEGYSPAQIYENIDAFSDGLFIRYPNLVTNSEKKWNSKKDRMNFNFESIGYHVSGNMHLDGKELIIGVKLPPVVKPYRKDITEKIEKTLEEIIPKIHKSE
jgi:hypothetical protein